MRKVALRTLSIFFRYLDFSPSNSLSLSLSLARTTLHNPYLSLPLPLPLPLGPGSLPARPTHPAVTACARVRVRVAPPPTRAVSPPRRSRLHAPRPHDARAVTRAHRHAPRLRESKEQRERRYGKDASRAMRCGMQGSAEVAQWGGVFILEMVQSCKAYTVQNSTPHSMRFLVDMKS